MEDTFKKFHGFSFFLKKDLNKNPMIFVGEKEFALKTFLWILIKTKLIMGFIFKKKKEFWVSKDPMIFMKMHISFRNFAHSKVFFFFLKESPTW